MGNSITKPDDDPHLDHQKRKNHHFHVNHKSKNKSNHKNEEIEEFFKVNIL
jgi:hypothetical protein